MTRIFSTLLCLIGLSMVSSALAHHPATASGSVTASGAAAIPFSATQEPTQHPIDKALDACTDKDSSTAGMVRCTDVAYKAWDRELNKNYLALMGKLKPTQKEALRLAQLEWIKQRDLDFKFLESIYDSFEGTMYIPMRIDARMQVIKKRAVELKEYLDLINDYAS